MTQHQSKEREIIDGQIKEDNDEGRKEQFMDIDRMINEGLGGGLVTDENGLIEETTTDTMDE